MSDVTRREGDEAGTRREGGGTRREESGGTRREGSGTAEAFQLVNLPPSLAERYAIDPYATQQLEAEGAQAIIVVARNRKSHFPVVIKIYRRGTTLDERAMDQLVEMGRDSEGRRHVVPILEYGTEAGLPWEVQEFMTHGSLESLLRADGPLSFDAARTLVVELTDALGISINTFRFTAI